MAGLLQAQQAPQVAPPQRGNKDSHESIMGRVKKVVMAAQQVMYNPKTSKMFIQQLQSAGKTPIERAGIAAAGVMAILMQQANGKMDPRTIVPAGVIVVADIMDFLSKTEGQQFGEEENNEAIKVFLTKITQAIGAQPQQAQQPQQQQQPQEVA